MIVVATVPLAVIYRNQSNGTWRLFSASTYQLTGRGGGEEVVFLAQQGASGGGLHTAVNINNKHSVLLFLLIHFLLLLSTCRTSS